MSVGRIVDSVEARCDTVNVLEEEGNEEEQKNGGNILNHPQVTIQVTRRASTPLRPHPSTEHLVYLVFPRLWEGWQL